MSLDLYPALRAVQTIHPRAKGAILTLHTEDGVCVTACASFDPEGTKEHMDELRTLVGAAPTIGKDFQESMIKAAAAARRGEAPEDK